MHGDAGMLLVSAAAGYWVLERAQAQKKGLKRAGRVIGWAIVLVSLIGVACRIWTIAMCQTGASGMGLCPLQPKKSGGMVCPLMPKSSMSQPGDGK